MTEQFNNRWWLIFLDPNKERVVHAAGYEGEPTNEDVQLLYEDLTTEFGMEWDYLMSLDVRLMKPDSSEEYTKFEAWVNSVAAQNDGTIH